MASDLNLDVRRYVYTHARAFEQHPDFTLLGGVDSCPQRRAQFSTHYGKPAFASVLDGLTTCRPEVVVIAVPTHAHLTILQEVLTACTPNVVLCEKPLAYEMTAGRTMMARCSEANCKLFVNYGRRADPVVREIKFRFETGQIASPVKGVVWYSKGLFHNGSHFFDLMKYWLGEMQAFHVVDSGRLWGDDPEPDVAITFGSSPVYFIAAHEECYSHYTAEIISPNGRLRYDLMGERVVWQPTVVSVLSPGYTVLEPEEQKLETELQRVQWHVADQLALALRGSQTQLCSGDEALKTIECLTLIRDAL